MILIPEINEKKTVENVRKFFNYEFPIVIIKAGYSDETIKHLNMKENNDELSQYEALVRSVVEAINRCPKILQEILSLSYINNISDSRIMERMGYGSSRYYELKRIALCRFADCFESVYDLHVFK